MDEGLGGPVQAPGLKSVPAGGRKDLRRERVCCQNCGFPPARENRFYPMTAFSVSSSPRAKRRKL